MKKLHLFTFLLFLFSASLFAQQERLADILQSSDNYEDIVERGEAYFQRKTPNVRLRNLAQGEFRDGEFVKFMRWRSFWKHSLNPDGTLGDISAYWREQQQQANLRSAESPYKDVPWTNLSYENYIVSQIGLGRTTSIGFHPTNSNIFYVGAAIGGVWRTTDGGQSYTPVGDELPFLAVSSIIVKKDRPDNIFIAVSDHVWYGPPGIGVYKSINDGATWQPTALSFQLADNIRIYWMEADPSNPNKMFAATSAGLYRTTNAFQSVTKISTVSCFDVKIHPGNSDIVYMGGNNGEFYRSTDGGGTFSLVQDFGNGEVYMATTPLNTAKVYARNGTTLHKSANSGASFPTTNSFSENTGLFVFSPTNQNTLIAGYIGVSTATERSDDDGASFYATSQWLGAGGLPSIHVDQRNVFTNPLQPDFVYFCNDGGVYRYSISNNSFENLCDGLQITQFYDIAVSQTDKNVIGGGSQDNGNVFRASNGVWDDYAPTGDGMNQEIDPTDANTRYWAYQNGSIRRWVNGVNTAISPPGQDGNGAWETPYRLDPTNPSRIVAGYDKVYVSTDKGTSWTDISGAANFGGDLEEIAIAKSNPDRIYAARGSNLYVKSTAGNTWTTRSMPTGVSMISDLEVDPANMDVIYISVPGYSRGNKVFKSTNAGASWTNISGSLPNVAADAIELYETIPNAIFVGTDAGVYYRDDSFDDWLLYGKIPHTRVDDIEIQYVEKLIRIGTHGRGVLEAPIIVENCDFGDTDADNDGVCDAKDACPNLDNSLIGTPCDDGDPSTTGETWTENCACEGGASNITYCAAAGSAGTGGDWIEGVSLHTLDHASGFSAYSDFRSQSTTLEAGGTYTLTIDLFQSFSLDAVYAWIDYDKDGTFEASELITMSDFDEDNKSTGTVTVPSNIGFGTTTMRVRSIYANPNTADPCGNYFGEVEDYTINFSHCAARGGFGTGDDWIKRVKLNTIDHSTIQTYYSDFKHISTDLVRGGSYPIEVTMNYAFADDKVYVWIDYDQDGEFEDSERINLPDFTIGSNQTSIGTINVPTGALPGKTIMRVRSQFDQVGDPLACGNTASGEVEDYTVNITYCAAAGSGGTGGDYINRVTFNTINNFSGKNGYGDFKHLSTDLTRGASYPIEVQLQYNFDIDSVYVWIDFNKDGVFEASEQTIMSKLTPLQFNQVSTGMVTVPADAIMGETTMRVRNIYSASNTAEPCGNYFGEVEDYTVNLTYCGGSGNLGDDHITRVRLNMIDHTSGGDGYSNFTNIQTTLYQNATYELRVNMNNTLDGDRVYAWIDYDKNGAFTTDERITMSVPPAGSNALSTGTIVVDPETMPGATTLRIRFNYGTDPDPCGNYNGEVEDYTIVIEESADNICTETDLVLGDEMLPSATYSGLQTLTSGNTIGSGSTVHFKAGNSITLTSGFHALNGSVFTAKIEACPPPVPPVSPIATKEGLTRSEVVKLALWPNPAREETMVAFSLPEAGTAYLDVYTSRGVQIRRLLDNIQMEKGAHQQRLETANFQSGLYFIVLRTANGTATKSLMIIK